MELDLNTIGFFLYLEQEERLDRNKREQDLEQEQEEPEQD